MTHPTDNTLLAYVAETIEAESLPVIDLHLTDCGDCLRRVRALNRLRDSWDEIWSNWNSGEHRRILDQIRLLDSMQNTKIPLTRRTLGWINSLATGAELGLKVLCDRGRRIAGIAARALPTAFEFEFRPAVAGVGSADEDIRLDAIIAQGNSALAEDRADEAVSKFVEASRVNAFIAQSATSVIYRDGKKYVEIVADSRRGSLLLRHWPGTNQASEYVLLLPSNVNESPALGVFEPVDGEEYVIAEFHDFPSGACDMIIGPSA